MEKPRDKFRIADTTMFNLKLHNFVEGWKKLSKKHLKGSENTNLKKLKLVNFPFIDWKKLDFDV